MAMGSMISSTPKPIVWLLIGLLLTVIVIPSHAMAIGDPEALVREILKIMVLAIVVLLLVITMKVLSLVLALLSSPSRIHGIVFSVVWGVSACVMVLAFYSQISDLLFVGAAITFLLELSIAIVWFVRRPRQLGQTS